MALRSGVQISLRPEFFRSSFVINYDDYINLVIHSTVQIYMISYLRIIIIIVPVF